MELANNEKAETKKANKCCKKEVLSGFVPKRSQILRIKLATQIFAIFVSKNELGGK
jgi:hypothetical protein